MPFCNKCGEKLDDNEEFCHNCGAKSKKYKGSDKTIKNTNKPNLIDTIISKPKLILLLIIVIIVFGGVIALTSNNSSNDGNYVGGHEVTIYGIPFNIPNGFEETKTVGNTVYFTNKNTQEGFSIRISTNQNLDLGGNHIQHKLNQNINGKEGVLVSYDSGAMVYYYYEGNYLICINVDTIHYNNLLKAIIK